MKRAFLVTLFAVTGLAAFAQDRPPQGDPGVAHISLIHGDVSMLRGDSGDWVATSINTPIVSGDTISTADGSRAEIQIDYANVLRLSGQSQAKIADLSRSHIQVQVSQGYANLSTFKGGEAEVEVDSPNVAVHPAREGRYRIEVNSDSETVVIVRQGEAEISTPQGTTSVREGEIISIRGTDDPQYKVSEAPGLDDWDQWNKDRDRAIRDAEGVRRTNPYYTGTHDLDAYGHWVNVPDYGEVWSPYEQPATWAPYQAGRWVWEPYYGWTWVSYEPWGWAPYHYGRWFFYDASWYWWPGPITPIYRPIWSPAFVSFIGFGPHVGFGFGFGSIGWFPLAPFEVFHPWWGVGFNRFSVVNINVNRFGFRERGFSNLNLALTNPRVRAGITTVSAENFGRGGGRFGHGVDVGTLREARLATGNIGVVPTRESLAPSNRGFSSAPSGIRNTGHFFSRTQASTSMPSFHSESARMQEAIRTHGGEGQLMARAQTGSENGRFNGNSSQNGNQNTRSDRPGWSSFGRGQDSSARSGNQPGGESGRFGSHTSGGQSQNNNPGGNRDGYRSFGSGSPGSERGTFDNRGGGQSGFPQNRSDRPSSSMGGGSSRPQVDMGKRMVVPRGDSGSRSAGSFGGNSGGRYNGGGSSGNYGGSYGDRGGNGGYSSYGGRSGNGGYSGGSYGGRSSNGGYNGGYSGRSGGGGYSSRSGSGSYSGGRSSSSGGGGGRSSGGGNHGGGSSRGGSSHR